MEILRDTEVYCDICGECVDRWVRAGNGAGKDNAAYYAREKVCIVGKNVVCPSCQKTIKINKIEI